MLYYGLYTGSGNFNRVSSVLNFGSKQTYAVERKDTVLSPSDRYTNLQSFNNTLDNFVNNAYTSVGSSGKMSIYDATVQGGFSSGSISELLMINRGSSAYIYVDDKVDYTNSATSAIILASGESIQLKGPITFVGISGAATASIDTYLKFDRNQNAV